MKKCMLCKKNYVSHTDYDYCYKCFKKKEKQDKEIPKEGQFLLSATLHEIHTVYIMFYENSEKIGCTRDLNSRLIEIKRQYPKNKLVYFREFTTETEAKRFEAWLKSLSKRMVNNIISNFQDKIKKIESAY